MTNLFFIHGAWASGWVWEPLLKYLDSTVIQCHVVNLPDSESYEASIQSQADLTQYTSHVLNNLEHIDEPVWLIAHSGGGITATAVAEQNPDKIAGIIYIAGMMLPSGINFTDLCRIVSKRGVDTQGIAPYLQQTPYGTKVHTKGISGIFLHDATQETIELANNKMVIQPNAARVVTLNWTAENAGRIPKYYILAENDRSLVPEVQHEMTMLTRTTDIATLPCGHFPQIVMPQPLAHIIMKFIESE
ncbi:alpha/beta hydrolase [Marinomonas sp. A79]|uniref:Alpha/beta hydrolase n=1 Tax=Marinomonas vulgaris TaxID=2823372 RepID=A0ABS5HC11_9GAMM|nr:alpha/beta hydrolase [Marinomonas vulgaris]MBR7888904.1 alpha/beta hydrolase [Marinomonas vulgaris]